MFPFRNAFNASIRFVIIARTFLFLLLMSRQELAYAAESPTLGTVGAINGEIPGVNDVMCIVKPQYRHRSDLFSKLDRALSPDSGPDGLSYLLRPPIKYSVYKTESSFLGVWAYTFTLGIPKTSTGVESALQKFFGGSAAANNNPFDGCIVSFYEFYTGSADSDSAYRWYDREIYKQPKESIPLGLLHDVPPRESRNLFSRAKNQIEVIAPALPELAILSWPKQNSLVKKPAATSYYRYQGTQGESTVVYIIDLDLDLSHPEFENINLQDWLDTSSFPFDKGTYSLFYSANYHGSTVAAKIVGQKLGIAPNANVVFIPVLDGTFSWPTATLLTALLKAFDHIKTVNSGSPCIINIAVGQSYDNQPKPNSNSFYFDAIEEILSQLSKLPDVAVVVSAGNDDKGPPSGVPEVFAKDLKNFVTVGATGKELENLYQFDLSYKNFVWAPGNDVTEIQPFDPRKDVPDPKVSLVDYVGDYYIFGRPGATSIGNIPYSGFIKKSYY
ncbi:Oryzin [Arthrobotrys entomopaga]|nr:Oryzin [Arthrobotrys entomopaga]